MISLKKKIFSLFLLLYFLLGSFNSLNTGLSFDENYEELNWNFHVNLVKEISSSISSEEKFDREKFNLEVKRFVGYGIGFQIISQPIQNLLKKVLIRNKDLDKYGAKLLAKHFVVFLFFFISGIFFYLILRKLIDNENFLILGTTIYLTFPYLFGQSMFSPKDVPFMSVWLVCSYFSFAIFEKIVNKENISFFNIFLLSLSTAYLLSIRIAGVLILIQYLVSLIILISQSKTNIIIFIKKFYKEFFYFIVLLFLFIFIFYPIFWINPYLLIDTIRINANHFNNVGTNTMGEIMYSKNLPSTYLFLWFAVKIPLFILIGLITIPFTEKKIFQNERKSIFFGTIIITIFLVLFILIINKVHLYDEIRQVMFLVPLIFICGLVSFFIFSKKIFYLFGILTIFLFLTENFKINPYQYVWFNLPSRAIDLSKNFELEYQGISGREISRNLKLIRNKNYCILANPIHSVKHFLNDTNFNCYDIWQKIDTNYERPFFAVQNVRNLKKSIPYKCFVIHETGFKLFFYENKIITGRLLECR